MKRAIGASDMPVESEPTKLLPFSQRYEEGYLAWRHADFREYFEAHCVQLPLTKGGVVFQSSAISRGRCQLHTGHTAYGESAASFVGLRSGNRDGWSRADERCRLPGPLREPGVRSDAEIDAVIASCPEGYSFPTNLDRDPPVGGLAPTSQQALLRRHSMMTGRRRRG
jgi:ectoine hydroxylase-related dioxygenase (phytanoyl-CoA dioxygenase family)